MSWPNTEAKASEAEFELEAPRPGVRGGKRCRAEGAARRARGEEHERQQRRAGHGQHPFACVDAIAHFAEAGP